MIRFIRYTFLLSLILFVSCEETVDIKMSDMEPRIVIDASISEDQSCQVIMTRTKSFNEDLGQIDFVSGAEIYLVDNIGNKELLSPSWLNGGIYKSFQKPISGVEYTLEVRYDDEVYKATATIPRTVYIDSIYTYNIRIGKTDRYSPCIIYQDPAEVVNYYYAVMYVNGSPMRSVYLFDDEHTNGLRREKILFYSSEDNNDDDLVIGDQIRVELQSIDKGTYTYYKSIENSSGGSNPTSNFTGGVLGLFKAYSTSKINMTIAKENIYTP